MSLDRFTYLISPTTEGESPVILGIAITGNTITSYVSQEITGSTYSHLPLIGRFFQQQSATGIVYKDCLDNYLRPENGVYFGGRSIPLTTENQPEHDRMHPNHDGENSRHHHLRHRQNIQPGQFNKFLDNLKKCEQAKKSPRPFLTDAVIKDLKKEYQKHYNEKKLDAELDTRKSNNPKYKHDNMPTTDQHVSCLTSQTSDFCLAFTPASSLPTPNTAAVLPAPQATTTPDYATPLYVGLFVVGLFAKAFCCGKRPDKAKKTGPARRNR